MTHKPSKTGVLGIPVSSRSFRIPEDLNASIQREQPVIVTFVNPHACKVSETHETYLDYLDEFDWVLCDGIGMVIAANRVGGLDITRAAFDLTSFAGPVCEWLKKENIPVVLVGGKPGISRKAANLLSNLFPGLDIVGHFSGYEDDPGKSKEFMAANRYAAIICGMGAPKQEEYLIELRDTGWSGIGFTCGGFLDQIVDRVDYYPNWVDKMNLRFLYRLLKEPRRLWRRYLVDYQVFMKRFIREFISA